MVTNQVCYFSKTLVTFFIDHFSKPLCPHSFKMFSVGSLKNQDAVTMVQAIPDAEEAARKLTDEALRKGSADNITCIVVRFNSDTV